MTCGLRGKMVSALVDNELPFYFKLNDASMA